MCLGPCCPGCGVLWFDYLWRGGNTDEDPGSHIGPGSGRHHAPLHPKTSWSHTTAMTPPGRCFSCVLVLVLRFVALLHSSEPEIPHNWLRGLYPSLLQVQFAFAQPLNISSTPGSHFWFRFCSCATCSCPSFVPLQARRTLPNKNILRSSPLARPWMP